MLSVLEVLGFLELLGLLEVLGQLEALHMPASHACVSLHFLETRTVVFVCTSGVPKRGKTSTGEGLGRVKLCMRVIVSTEFTSCSCFCEV